MLTGFSATAVDTRVILPLQGQFSQTPLSLERRSGFIRYQSGAALNIMSANLLSTRRTRVTHPHAQSSPTASWVLLRRTPPITPSLRNMEPGKQLRLGSRFLEVVYLDCPNENKSLLKFGFALRNECFGLGH